MWPASASTTIPSGIGPAAVTMTFLSEPSGFTETMRPSAPSRKNKRETTALRTAGRFDLGVCVVIIFPFVCVFVFISMEFRLKPELHTDKHKLANKRKYDHNTNTQIKTPGVPSQSRGPPLVLSGRKRWPHSFSES